MPYNFVLCADDVVPEVGAIFVVDAVGNLLADSHGGAYTMVRLRPLDTWGEATVRVIRPVPKVKRNNSNLTT